MDHFDFQLLREIRRDRGLSQERLARECNVSTPTIINLELGRQNPSLATLSSISRVLGIELSTCIRASYRKAPRLLEGMPGPYQPVSDSQSYCFRFRDVYATYVEIPADHEENLERLPFAEVYVYIIEGHVDICVDGNLLTAGPGQVVIFDGLSDRKITTRDHVRTVGVVVPKRDPITRQIIRPGMQIVKEQPHPLVVMDCAKHQASPDVDFTIIKILRQCRQMSLEKLSSVSGVSVPAISSIELNKRVPTLGTVSHLASSLDVDTDDLIDFACRRKGEVIDAVRSETHPEKDHFEIMEVAIGPYTLHYGKNITGKDIVVTGHHSPSMHVLMAPVHGSMATQIGGKEITTVPGKALLFDSRHARTHQFSPDLEGYSILCQRG